MYRNLWLLQLTKSLLIIVTAVATALTRRHSQLRTVPWSAHWWYHKKTATSHGNQKSITARTTVHDLSLS